MTTTYIDPDGTILNFSKGALERVFEICTTYKSKTGSVEPLTQEYKSMAEAKMLELAAKGYRVLAFASKETVVGRAGLSDDDSTIKKDPVVIERAIAESESCFVGLTAMYDPPRAETAPSIEECRKAGIAVHMVKII